MALERLCFSLWCRWSIEVLDTKIWSHQCSERLLKGQSKKQCQSYLYRQEIVMGTRHQEHKTKGACKEAFRRLIEGWPPNTSPLVQRLIQLCTIRNTSLYQWTAYRMGTQMAQDIHRDSRRQPAVLTELETLLTYKALRASSTIRVRSHRADPLPIFHRKSARFLL